MRSYLRGIVVYIGIILIIAAFFAPSPYAIWMVVLGFFAIPVGIYIWLFMWKEPTRRQLST